MALSDVMIGAAALWLLFIFSGLPGQKDERMSAAGESAAFLAIAGDASAAPLPYSVWHEETPQPRHVTPPLPGAGATATDITHNALGSAPIPAIGLPQVLSLAEVAIAPGGRLALANLDGSGVIVVQTGWLELAAREGDTRLTRSPLAESSAPEDDEALTTIAPGDRLAFGPGATIVLRNRGEQPARVLTASVLVKPGLAA